MALLHPPQGKSLGEGKAGSPGAGQTFLEVCKGSFPEGIAVCPKGPLLPQALHTAHPAWPRCSQGICMGQSRVANLLPHCTRDGSTWAMPRHLLSLHFLRPHHPSSPAGADLLPGMWHTVSLGPARAIMCPHLCPPQPGKRKTDLCKGQLMRKLFASRSAGSAGEEQGSSQVARLSDDNKLAQPEHATSSNARLFPLFWENKRGTRPFLARSCPA